MHPLSTWPARLRLGTAVAFLAAQIGAIAYARFAPSRYFAWAPYDVINLYTLDVTIDGRRLEAGEVRLRYVLPQLGRDNRSIQHVKDHVRQYEETYGAGDGARVLLTYTVNGRPQEPWRWPPR